MLNIEKRKIPREDRRGKIEFYLNTDYPRKLVVAFCDNITDEGMCIYTFSEISEGDVLEFKTPFSVPYNKAIVRWVSRYTGSLHKAGIVRAEG